MVLMKERPRLYTEVLTDHLEDTARWPWSPDHAKSGRLLLAGRSATLISIGTTAMTGGACCGVRQHWLRPCNWTSFEPEPPSPYSTNCTNTPNGKLYSRASSTPTATACD